MMMYPQMISLGDGIFTDLQSFDVPWKNLGISSYLNFGYYQNSARKTVSPLVVDVCNNIAPLTQEQRSLLAGTIYNIYSKKWERLWGIYQTEYDPLQNYLIEEDETINTSGSSTTDNTGTQTTVIDTDTTNTGTDTVVVDDTITNTGTDTHNISKSTSDGGNESVRRINERRNTGTNTIVTDSDSSNTGTVTTEGTSSTLDGVFGFNSANSVGSDTRDVDADSTRTDNLASTVDTTETNTQNLTEAVDGTDTRTRALTHTETNSDTNTKNLTTDQDTTQTETKNLASTVDTTNTRTDNLTRESEEQTESVRSLSKSGNIGFNTPQEMLFSDLELWQWNFFKSVFDDIDSILTIPIY